MEKVGWLCTECTVQGGFSLKSLVMPAKHTIDCIRMRILFNVWLLHIHRARTAAWSTVIIVLRLLIASAATKILYVQFSVHKKQNEGETEDTYECMSVCRIRAPQFKLWYGTANELPPVQFTRFNWNGKMVCKSSCERCRSHMLDAGCSQIHIHVCRPRIT